MFAGFKKNVGRFQKFWGNTNINRLLKWVGRFLNILRALKFRNPSKNDGWFQKNVGQFQNFREKKNGNRLLLSVKFKIWGKYER